MLVREGAEHQVEFRNPAAARGTAPASPDVENIFGSCAAIRATPPSRQFRVRIGDVDAPGPRPPSCPGEVRGIHPPVSGWQQQSRTALFHPHPWIARIAPGDDDGGPDDGWRASPFAPWSTHTRHARRSRGIASAGEWVAAVIAHRAFPSPTRGSHGLPGDDDGGPAMGGALLRSRRPAVRLDCPPCGPRFSILCLPRRARCRASGPRSRN